MSIENKSDDRDKGDYVGYCIQTDGGTGIQLIGPMERSKAVQLATEIANNYSSIAIRVFANNKGSAILKITEAFNRREKLEKKGILP